MGSRILVLGVVGVEAEGGFSDRFRTQSARRVLLHLALSNERGLGRGELAGLVWPGLDQEKARTSLRTALSSLRKMGAEIASSQDTLRLTSDTDLAQFQRLIKRRDWLGACRCYRGLFAPGEDDPLLAGAAREFEGLFLRALEEAAGSGAASLLDLEKVSFSDAEAKERAQESLRRTKQGSAYGLPLTAHPHPIIGREAWVAKVLAALKSDRWLTLVAPGGSGKTRIALEASLRAQTEGQSVLFLSLESQGPDSDWVRIASDTLGLEGVIGLDPLAQVEHFLRGRSWLVVVDGAEDRREMAEAIAQLGRRLPSVRLLFTSRQPLPEVPGAVLALPMLEVSDSLHSPEGPAEQLLRTLAQSHKADGARLDREALREIALRLGGHPLGLHLAAAQLGSDWSPSQMVKLAGRMSALSSPGGRRGLTEALGWTLEECRASARERLPFLAHFRAGFRESCLPPEDLAELRRLAVVQLGPGGLWRLVEPFRKLVLEQDEPAILAEARREFCLFWSERAARAKAVSYTGQEHLIFAELDEERENIEAALELLQATDSGLFVESASALSWFWVMRGRFSRGVFWGQKALAFDPSPVHRTRLFYIVGLSLLCMAQFSAAEEILDQALESALSQRDAPRAALARLNLATLYCDSKRADKAAEGLALALEGLQEDQEQGRQASGKVLGALVLNRLHRHQEALELAESAHETFHRLGYLWGIGSSLNELGSALSSLGRHQAAAEMQAESARARRQTGFQRGVAVALVDQARSLLALERMEEARSCLEEAIHLYEGVGDRWGQARALRIASDLARLQERAWDSLVLWAAADLADSAYGGSSTDNRTPPEWLASVNPADWPGARALARQSSAVELCRSRL